MKERLAGAGVLTPAHEDCVGTATVLVEEVETVDELKIVEELEIVDEELETDVDDVERAVGTEEEEEATVLDVEACEVVVGATLLELETTTGFRLLYIDSLLAPPHFQSLANKSTLCRNMTYPFVGVGLASVDTSRCCQHTSGAERITTVTFSMILDTKPSISSARTRIIANLDSHRITCKQQGRQSATCSGLSVTADIRICANCGKVGRASGRSRCSGSRGRARC